MKYRLAKNYELIYKNIKTYFLNYLERTKIKNFILGVSGGIDSCLVAALICKIKQEENLDINLIGRSLFIKGNKFDEIRRSIHVGAVFCDEFEYHGLNIQYYLTLLSTYQKLLFKNDFDSKIRKGNIKARLRMIYLYDLARKNNGIVLSTDNLTEYFLGFWTLHGDVGDLGLIQNLWKTEVYELSWFLANSNRYGHMPLNECVTAMPTDGLGITESDYDQFGLKNETATGGYRFIDEVLINHLNNPSYIGPTPKIIERYLNSQFKRENPESISREYLLNENVVV